MSFDSLLAPVPAVLMIYGTLAGGAWLRKLGRMTDAGDAQLLWLLINVLVPGLIIGKLLGEPLLREPINLVFAPLAGLVGTLLGYALAMLAAWWLGPMIGLRSVGARRAFAMTAGMVNYGYIPLPLAVQLTAGGIVPGGTVPAIFLHNVGVDVAMWSVGIVVISGHLDWGAWRKLLNAPLIAIAGVILLNLTGLPYGRWAESAVLDWINTTGNFLGGAAFPVALLLIGSTAMAAWLGGAGKSWRVMAAACGFRLGLMPPVLLGLAWLMPQEQAAARAAVAIEAAMPSALFPILLSKIYGADASVAVQVAVATSVVSVLTLPVWLAVGLAIT